jgi:hypothetical protein
VLSDISGDSTIVMSSTPGKHHDRQLRKDLTFLVCRRAMTIAVASLKDSTFAAWYLDLIAAGGKLKGKQPQSKPFSTKDVVDNRRLKQILVVVFSRSDIL